MANIWEQIGLDLFGKNAADSFGFTGISLSSDGSFLAVGAQTNDDNGTDSGHVRIFENKNNNWIQVGSDIVGQYAYDQSGVSVDLSDDGKIVAIGSWHNDGTQSNLPGYDRQEYPNGHVRVYQNLNNTWIQVGNDIEGQGSNEWSGRSVTLSSNGSIVGIGGQYSQNNSVYENINNIWTKVGGQITAESGSTGATSLSSNGSIFAIADDNGGSNMKGLVRIFQNIQGNWGQLGNDIGAVSGDERLLGHSIHLSANGSILAIGIPYTTNNTGGLVRVYEFKNNQWLQIGTDIDEGNIPNEFGMDISLSADGSILAIGAPSESQNNVYGGSVRIYQNINDAYVQVGNVINGNPSMTNIGYSIDLSSDGSTLAIGSRANGIRVYSIDLVAPNALSNLEVLEYIASNHDLIAAFGTDTTAANDHYNNLGKSEGRSLDTFNVTQYLANYSDLAATFGTNTIAAIQHYISNGYAEGRTDPYPLEYRTGMDLFSK